MEVQIRTTTVVPNHIDSREATASIPAGTELKAWVDDGCIAWAPYEGETYAVFPSEYELAMTPAQREPVTAG